MLLMVRRLVILATLLSVFSRATAGQALGVLHIKVILIDANKKATPVPDHALLISDNPSTAPPRRVSTALNGTVDVRLRPGNYTVESDRPVAFQGKTYQWTQTVDVLAGRDAVLELTAVNTDGGSDGSAVTAGTPSAPDSSSLLTEWQNSVVALWTPTAHASAPSTLYALSRHVPPGRVWGQTPASLAAARPSSGTPDGYGSSGRACSASQAFATRFCALVSQASATRSRSSSRSRCASSGIRTSTAG